MGFGWRYYVNANGGVFHTTYPRSPKQSDQGKHEHKCYYYHGHNGVGFNVCKKINWVICSNRYFRILLTILRIEHCRAPEGILVLSGHAVDLVEDIVHIVSRDLIVAKLDSQNDNGGYVQNLNKKRNYNVAPLRTVQKLFLRCRAAKSPASRSWWTCIHSTLS